MPKYLVMSLLFVSFLAAKTHTLQSLIAYGLEHSPLIKQTEAQRELAEAVQKENRAKGLGTLDVAASYTKYNLPRTLAPLTPSAISSNPAAVATTKDLLSTNIVYSVPLFTGFAQSRQIEMDAIAKAIYDSKLSLSKEELAYNVASLYLSILSLEEMLQAQRRHVRALKKLTTTVERGVKLGKNAPIDLFKAQSDLHDNIAYAQTLESNIEIAKASLAATVGAKRIDLLKPVKVAPAPVRIDLDALLQKANKLHKLRIATLQILKAKKGIQKSRAPRYPQVSLNAMYGYNHGYIDDASAFIDRFRSQEIWQVTLNAKWTLYDFGKSDAGEQKAKIAHLQAWLEKQRTLAELRKSLTEAYAKIKEAYAHYRGGTKRYALAKKSAEIEAVRYENGVSTINDLLFAQSRAQIAKAKLIESKYNYQKAKFYIDYLLEKGLQ